MKYYIKSFAHLFIAFSFILLLNLVNSQSLAQNKVTIKVLDIDRFEPISQVNVKITNKQYGTSTNMMGFCEILILKLPINLTFSHVAFETKSVVIEKIPINDTLTVRMKSQTTMLSEVNVQALKLPERYYEDVSIIDFELHNDNILILEKIEANPGKYRITEADINLENKRFHDVPITLWPEKLYKDCLNACHIITKDSAFQIVKDSMGIHPKFSMELNQFYQIMDGCLFQIENEVYFKEVLNEGYQYNFFYVNVNDKSVHNFKSDFDQKRLNKMNESIRWTRKNPGGSANVSMYFDKYYLFSPLPQFLMNKFDTLVYFNHQQGSIEIYSHIDNCIRTIKTEYQKSKNWKKEILKDEINEVFYTLLGRDLYEIDLNNGTIIFKLTIGNVYKIIIYNHCVYLLKSKTLSTGKTFRYIEKFRL